MVSSISSRNSSVQFVARMRLSTVFELLVIALLIAFAASRVIDGPDRSKTLARNRQKFTLERQNQDPPSRHCTCSSLTCNCCRDFSLPIVPVKGPGCATVSYLHDDVMMITMSFGDRVLRNITVDSKKPKPICMGMPGGISKFCGRLYNIKKEGEDFKACLGLELRALDDVEAALRISCFKFGSGGVNVEPGEAIPAEKSKEDEYDEDDDDYGLGALDDDDDDDDDFGLSGSEDDDDDEDEERPPAKDTYNYVDSSDSDADYTGLGSLSEELFGGFFGSSSKKKKPGKIQEVVYVSDPLKTQQQAHSQSAPPQLNLVVMQPVILPATKPPRRAAQKRPVQKPATVNPSITNPAKRATTPTPVKKIKTTTPSPVRTLAPSTTPSVSPSNNPPVKNKKKKKKPTRKRNPTTPKPSFNNSTDSNQTVITTTTKTVNVVQGGVNLNDTTKFQTVENPASEAPLKIPMSQPVLETKPVEFIQQSNESLKTNLKQSDKIYTTTENIHTESTEGNEYTTQTIMQNTIPIDESFKDNEQLAIKKPILQQNHEVVVDDIMIISTTPNTLYTAEETTNQESTVQVDYLSYNNNFKNNIKNEDQTTLMNTEATDDNTDTIYEVTTASASSVNKYKQTDETLGTSLDRIDSTQSLNTATMPYDIMEEGTDKTEALTNNNSSPQEGSSEQENENDDDEDDDDTGIDDIGADLGLVDDDDEEEEENSQRKPSIISKPEEKDDEDDDDDILGDLLDDDDDSKTKGKEEERALGNNKEYKINPLLYRIARVSSGYMATARHLPRFSDGRNRRNNKRMRFPSLELTP